MKPLDKKKTKSSEGKGVKVIKHFKVITKHKIYVMIECFKRGLYWQGLIHDLSKYSLEEFIQSANYFQGTGTPINKIKAELGYSIAWLHHKGHNKHHWEYWTDFYEGEIKPIENIPKKYLLEMVCDMIGASKAYLKEKYNPKEPLKYFIDHKDNWLMTEENKLFIEKELEKL